MAIEDIKLELSKLIGRTITLTATNKKHSTSKTKGVLTSVSDHLFCIEVPIGKTHKDTQSYSFNEIMTGFVTVEEIL